MIKYEEIREVHLELSTNCNASCPLCPRNFNGYPYNAGYPVTELTLHDVKNIFPVEFVRRLRHVIINGNLGDFMLAKDALEIIRYFRENGQHLLISINTNASARTSEFWKQLAALKPVVYFAIDGLEDTHSLYRVDTNFNTVIKNAQTFIQAGGNATWKMIKFDHNTHQIDECKKLSKELGFRSFLLVDQGRDNGYVYNRKGELTHTIGDVGEISGRANPVTWEERLGWSKINFEKKVHFLQPVRNQIKCDSVKNKSIYVMANGEVYPCCYLGFYPRTYDTKILHGIEQIKQLLGDFNNNAKEKPLSECIEWFNRVEDSWSKKSFQEGLTWQCNSTCGCD